MKRKNAIDNLFVTGLFVILISSIIFIGCGSNTEETENTEVIKVTEDSEVAESIKTTEPEVTVENTDTQAQENTQATTSTEPAKTNNNSGSSNKGTTASSNKSGSTSSSGNTSSKPAHQHNWKAVYRTVHHDAVTHTEDQGYYEDRGYNRTVISCKTCGATFTSMSDLEAHKNVSREMYPDDDSKWHVGSVTKTEWVSNNVWVSNIVTVTDNPAWDEQVLDHYECSCGATK